MESPPARSTAEPEDQVFPAVSVIVPAYRAAATVDRCIESLLSQDYRGSFEILLVVSGIEPGASPTRHRDPRLRVVTQGVRLPAATARNRGVSGSSGDLLAFTDADGVADPAWISELVAASEGRYCVAGSVLNGTPHSAAGTVEYWTEFLDLHPARRPATAWHGATCNLLIPRALWVELAPFPTDLDGGEDTLLTANLRRRGLFRFAPAARVIHLNRTRWRQVIRHQFEAGVFTARIGRAGPYKLRPLVRYSVLAPVAALARVLSVSARVVAWDRAARSRLLWLFPGVVLTLGAWGTGLAFEGLKLDLFMRRRARPMTGA